MAWKIGEKWLTMACNRLFGVVLRLPRVVRTKNHWQASRSLGWQSLGRRRRQSVEKMVAEVSCSFVGLRYSTKVEKIRPVWRKVRLMCLPSHSLPFYGIQGSYEYGIMGWQAWKSRVLFDTSSTSDDFSRRAWGVRHSAMAFTNEYFPACFTR